MLPIPSYRTNVPITRRSMRSHCRIRSNIENRKSNTRYEKIDEPTTEGHDSRGGRRRIFLDTEEKSPPLASRAEESSAAVLAELDSVEGRFMASSEKESDRLRKVRDRAKKRAEASRRLEVIEKAEREAAVVKIVDEHKRAMKHIAAKHYREMMHKTIS